MTGGKQRGPQRVVAIDWQVAFEIITTGGQSEGPISPAVRLHPRENREFLAIDRIERVAALVMVAGPTLEPPSC
jgi:hypothetical protein